MDRNEIVRQCKYAIEKGWSVESYEFYESVIELLNERPLIKKSFPLKCCSYCTGMRPYVMTEDLFGDDKIIDHVLTIGCENEHQCRFIYENMKNDVKKEVSE